MVNCTFNGDLTVTSPGFLLKTSTFNSTSSFTRNGSSTNHQSDGGNIFNGAVTINNAGSGGRIRMATTTGDYYYGNATFNSSAGQDVQICYSGNSYFYGDVTINSNKVVFNTASGKVTFAGSNSQSLNGSYNFPFKKLAIDKTLGEVTANSTLSVDDSLFFIQGYLFTNTTNLITLKAGSKITGASNNSFVEGPIVKIGNTAFAFPIGKDTTLRVLTMSAPSSLTDSYLAEYFNGNQIIGDSLDGTLHEISYCNYWNFMRKIGSSNVDITLPWDTSFCALFDTTYMRFGNWDSIKWVDAGHGTIIGNSLSGSMTINSNSKFGYYTFGTTAIAPACSTATYTWNNTSSLTLNISNFALPPGQSLAILGTFTVDQNLVISNCSNIIMGDDAKIIVDPGHSLTISRSRLYPCNNYQWDYIKVTGNTAKLFVFQSQLIGADTAIWSNAGGYFSVNKYSAINRCFKGIMADSYGSPHTGNIQASWVGCATLPGGSTATTLFPPHSTVRTSKGMHISNATSMTIGQTPSTLSDVNFYNCDIGIDNTNTSLTVRNCNFDKMDNKGVGVKSATISGSFSLVVGNGASNSCNFTNSTYGVFSINNNATISNNYFNLVEYGIRMTNSSPKTLTANINQINLFNIGIGVYSKSGATVTINSNQLNAPNLIFIPVNLSYYGYSGIEVHNGVLFNSSVTVSSNWIANTRKGISLMNINGTQFTTSDNQIDFSIQSVDLFLLPNWRHYGIRSLNCYHQNMLVNTIERPASTPASSGAEWKNLFGIQGSFLYNSDIGGNNLFYTSSGVNLRDVSLSTFSRCNVFYECFRGIDIGEAEIISGFPSGISATVTGHNTPVRDDSWFASTGNPAYTNRVSGWSANLVYWAYYTGTTPANSSYPTETNSYNVKLVNATASSVCPAIPLIPDFDREGSIGSIVADTLRYDDFPLERRYAGLCFALRELRSDTARLHIDDKDSVYIEFYNNYKHTNIAKFIYIEELINDQYYDVALDSTTAISDTNTYESYRKTVLTLFLSKYIIDHDFSSEDSLDLESIANECAMIGGPAVFEARAMLDTNVYDTCVTSGSRLTSHWNNPILNRSENNYFKVNPNPASSSIFIVHHIEKTDLVFELYDISGRKILNAILFQNTGKTQINIENITQGVYIYKIRNADKQLQYGKIIVER